MVSHFIGGDPGEGLDLSGNIIYGVNVGTVGAPPGLVQDVEFTDGAQPGSSTSCNFSSPNSAARAADSMLKSKVARSLPTSSQHWFKKALGIRPSGLS
ncbi:MAG: hypothetical protein ACKV19_11110 [Verrucomicrobiales bacterium]